jgi:transposase-like protein
MKTRRKFTSAQKTHIVLSIISKESTILEVSKKENLAPSLIATWKDQYLAESYKAFEKSSDETEKDLKIRKYEHVITKLTTQNDFLEKVLLVTK